MKKREFLTRPIERGYPQDLVEKISAEVQFSSRNTALKKTNRKYLKRFRRSLRLSILLTWILQRFLWNTGILFQATITWRKYNLISPIVTYRKDRSLKDSFLRAQLSSLKLHYSILGVTHGKGLMTIQQHFFKIGYYQICRWIDRPTDRKISKNMNESIHGKIAVFFNEWNLQN